jgi:ABC-type multidrug transport system fused ATPase/permease subunit
MTFLLYILFLASYLKTGADCLVSIRRLQHYLETPELPISQNKEPSLENQSNQSGRNVALSLRDVSCYWDFRSNTEEEEVASGFLALDGINIDLKMNELTCVVGSVGSGKSAFLLALAGELVAQKGTIERSRTKLAFANQNPWIMNGSVVENILMGLPYDRMFYNEVVKSCGLDVDFEQFIDGDKTIVGDRGVQCSGGQVSI